jgi:hypothetical protein
MSIVEAPLASRKVQPFSSIVVVSPATEIGPVEG